MARLLLFCLKVTLVVVAAYWLAERPGVVVIEWLGYRIETTVGILLLAGLVLTVAVALIYRFWRFVYRAPREIGRTLQASRRRRGYKALTQGMVAVAAGEPDEAARLARRAAALLDEPPLTMLLSAQAAQLNGDEAAARRYFTAMLENPETRFLGLRGLLTQALREGDEAAALDYVRQAYRLRPRTPWVVTTLFDLSERRGDLDTAERALAEAARIKALPAPEATRKRAVVLLERAEAAHHNGDDKRAMRLAQDAFKLAPVLVPAAVLAARLLAAGGQRRRALKVLERAWAAAPHPDLAETYLAVHGTTDGLARVKAIEHLVAANPDHPESHLALARAALDAQLWGEARRHLRAAAGAGGLDGNPDARICRLMAELEEAENGDTAAARAWLAQAQTAPRDPAWVCNTCGAVADAWRPRCGACGTFDALAWQPPRRVSPALVADVHDGTDKAPLPAPAASPTAAAGAGDDAPAQSATRTAPGASVARVVDG